MLKLIARGLLWLGRWKVIGDGPDVPKALYIAAPHTSNWDGYWAIVYRVAIRTDIRFFAKQSLFWFPLGTLLRAFGGVPLDRTRAGSAVDQAVALFRNSERCFFALAPEGTRARTNAWKSGFYRIALAADVPIIAGFLDYGKREIGCSPAFRLSGDKAEDRARIAALYAGRHGKNPDQMSPIDWHWQA